MHVLNITALSNIEKNDIAVGAISMEASGENCSTSDSGLDAGPLLNETIDKDDRISSADQLSTLVRSSQADSQDNDEAIQSNEKAVQSTPETDHNNITVRAYQYLPKAFTETYKYNKNAIEGFENARKAPSSIETDDTEVRAGDREVGAYQQSGYNHYHAGQYQESIAYYKQALVSHLSDPRKKFDAYLGLGNAFSQIDEIETSQSYFLKALTLSKQINDKSLQKEVHKNLGSVYYKYGMLDAAVESYFKLHKILDDLGMRKEKADACVLLGDIFLEREQYEYAIKSFQSTIKIGKKLEEKEIQTVGSQKLGRLYVTLGSVSSKDGDYDKAIKCYKEALIIFGAEPIHVQLREQALIGLGEAWLNVRSSEEADSGEY